MKISPRPRVAYVGDLIKLFVGKNTAVPILTGPLKGKKWILGSSSISHALTFHEGIMEKFEELVSKSSVVFDLGAHAGWYTLLASELVGQEGEVIAFEPLPSMLRYLERHVELNHCCNVQIIEAAVSDNDGDDTFYATEDGSLGAVSTPGLGHVKSSVVRTVRIDTLVQGGQIPPPDFIKINIEGGELLALKGAKSTLVNYAPTIFLATHGYDLCVNCSNFLTSVDYELDKLKTPTGHTQEFVAHKNKARRISS